MDMHIIELITSPTRALRKSTPLRGGSSKAYLQCGSRAMNLTGRVLLALLLLNLLACSSMQTVSIESAMQYSPPRGVDYGSLVVVKTLDKREARFRVTEITDDGLGGQAGFFAYEDMESLKVDRGGEQSVEWGTVIGAILGIAALVFLIDNSDSVRVCSGTPCPEPNP